MTGMRTAKADAPPDVFAGIYEDHFDFVWRNVRRLGVPDADVDDAVQDVFVIVHRKLVEFEGRSSIKTWLFGILMRVASDRRRSLKRKRSDARSRASEVDVDALTDDRALSAHDRVSQREAADLLHRLLEALNDEQRAVLVMVELEQMAVPDVALALGIGLNSAYSRLRTAREAFERAVKRAKLKGDTP